MGKGHREENVYTSLAKHMRAPQRLMDMDHGEQFIVADRVVAKMMDCMGEEDSLRNIFKLIADELEYRNKEQSGG